MSLPYFEPPSLDTRLPIHIFGAIVTVGMMIGTSVLLRYARRVGESQAQARSLAGWVAGCGIVGAHVLDVLFYRPGEAWHHPIVLLEVWTSISSYGGFIGGALAFAVITWRRKLRVARWADITIVGLLVAFSIGRAGCTAVHDHIGAPTTSAIGIDFPRQALVERGLADEIGATGPVVRAHDLAFEELLYLIPVNALVLWLAFRRGKRKLPDGTLAVLAAGLYAPVRFGLEHWRLASTDPPYAGLTFAQWCSLVLFAAAIVLGARIAVLARRE
ncbi:MAG TPA: prolipoprotein diacylglyceryl transferase family protein [Kofleriaceae bacterium]